MEGDVHFEPSDEQRLLMDTTRKFCQSELPPLAEELERDAKPLPRDWLKRYARLGFLGINTPADYGGMELTHLDAVLVLEEFAKISVAVAFPVFEACVGPVQLVRAFGKPALRERVVPPVVQGDMIVAAAMSESEAGTALTDLRTTGRLDGDEVVLTGSKRWCSGAGHADGYVVFCRLGEAPGAKGIGAVFVERSTPGISFGKPERLMGFRGVPSADIYFDGCRVPRDHLLVEAGGFQRLMGAFNLERCGNAIMAVGAAAGALEQVVTYAQERKQFGKSIVDFQAVQLRLAEIAIMVEAARLLVHRAAVTSEADGFPSPLPTSFAKCFANEKMREAAGFALQLMGAYGYAEASGMERRFRDAWGWGIAGGTIDIQKINIAGALVGRRFDQRR